ncbi:MAG: RHS repeat-associated core domain-containing protein [Phycisphaerae bacterium]|jgi:RHS repeat-associated protein
MQRAYASVLAAGSTPVKRNIPAPGWGAGMSVSPFSAVNLRNGNVLTAIPLVSWDPAGPPVGFTLYHNSLAAPYDTDSAAWGFDLGDGWSVSYGGHVEGSNGDTCVTVVHADGRRDVYTWVDGEYVPPAGVHDLLTWDGGASEWTLTSPDQTQAVFNDDGFLVEVLDSSGNACTVERDGGYLTYVNSAAHGLSGAGDNRLELRYYDNRLYQIEDPIDRIWEFEYDGSGRLWKIHYPSDGYVAASCVEILYEAGASNRIQHIRSREYSVAASPSPYAWTWSYTYTDGCLTLVEDPDHDIGEVDPVRYEQEFAYEATPGGDDLWETTYTDRRGYDWLVRFDTAGDAVEYEDPLESVTVLAYDADHNMVEYTDPTDPADPLSHTWRATYGPVGNVETVTSPIAGQTWTYTWEQPEPSTRPNLYRLTQVSDPVSGWVSYEYACDDPDDPTLVTSVTEMADGQGNPAAVTTIQYYGNDPQGDPYPNAAGQVAVVIDANEVHHVFEYDDYGYAADWSEGLLDDARIWPPVLINPAFVCGAGSNATGWPTTRVVLDNGCEGNAFHDANGSLRVCLWTCPTRSGENEMSRILGVRPGGQPSMDVPVNCSIGTAEYDIVGRLENVDTSFCGTGAGCLPEPHSIDPAYDDLGRQLSVAVSTYLPDDSTLERVFEVLEYDADGNPLSVEGPDGQTIVYTFGVQPGYDELGRPSTVTRGGMSATYIYDDAGRLERIEYGNDTKVVRHYDAADRLDWIEHRDDLDAVLLRVDYVWNLDNTLYSRTETDNVASETAVVTFTYDNRKRLIAEERVVNSTTTVYDLTYSYDQLGNRLEKVDYAPDPDQRTTYFYDSDPANRDPAYPTNNNRLLWYVEAEADGLGGWTTLRTVQYTYYEMSGHTANITVKDEGNAYYRNLALYYTSAGQLWRVLWDQWQIEDDEVTGYQKLAGREFYYDGPSRYLMRELDVSANDPNNWAPTGDWLWTDQTGMLPWGDFTTDGSYNVVESERYLPGAGVHAQQTLDGENDPIRYLHGDLIDSTVLTTDESADAAGSLAYTAFGEPVGSAAALGTRYQYAGGYGYESGLLALPGAPGTQPITLLHVGWRWYDAGSGRFVMRDPIGLLGGANVYLYADAAPTASIDPDGLEWKKVFRKGKWVWVFMKNGRFAKPPLIGRIAKGALKRFPVYWGGKQGAKGIYWLIGEQYPGDPEDILAETAYWTCVLVVRKVDNVISSPACKGLLKKIGDRLGRLGGPAPCRISCFVEGTVVHTPDGPVRIEQLDVGYCVLSGAEGAAEETVEVTHALTGSARRLIRIDFGDDIVTCTAEHPFLLASGSWKRACELTQGDSLATGLGVPVSIERIEEVRLESDVRVFNLSVSGTRTFQVGKHRVIVHNKSM